MTDKDPGVGEDYAERNLDVGGTRRFGGNCRRRQEFVEKVTIGFHHSTQINGGAMNNQTADVEQLSAQIVALDVQIDRLKDKAQSEPYGANAEDDAAIEALQLKRDQAALKLQGIAPTSDNEWQDVKAGSEDVMDEVRSIFMDAITKIK